MANIERAMSNTTNHVIVANDVKPLTLIWVFNPFSPVTQEAAEIRWRLPSQAYGNIRAMMGYQNAELYWNGPVSVSRFEDTSHWLVVGGELQPPAPTERRFSNILHITFPINSFPPTVWIFQVRVKAVDQDWGDWIDLKVEVNPYDMRTTHLTSSSSIVVGPGFPSEGRYAARVKVMNAAGAITLSDEQEFDVWDTDTYLRNGTTTEAVPMRRKDATGTRRVAKS